MRKKCANIKSMKCKRVFLKLYYIETELNSQSYKKSELIID